MRHPLEEMLSNCRAEKKELEFDLTLEKRLNKGLMVALVIFIIGMGLLSNRDMARNRVLATQNDSLYKVIDSLHFVISCKDTFILKQSFYEKLKTPELKRAEAKRQKLMRLNLE